jgi:hypothetical protein
MSFRFIDLESCDSEYDDFIIRKRHPSLKELFVVLTALIITSSGVAVSVSDPLAEIAILFLMIGMACWYAVFHVNRNRMLLRATEFESALFASALAEGYAFCLIVGTDGVITYCNPGFIQTVADVKGGSSLKDCLAAGNAPPEDSQRLLDAIAHGASGQMPLALDARDTRRHSFRVSLQPIGRPHGFVLLRGVEGT